MTSEFRRLPSVDKILSEERLKELGADYPHELLVSMARQQLEVERQSIAGGKPSATLDQLVEAVVGRLRYLEFPGLRQVINATGVVLHTNLGRAPLSKEAIAAMDTVSAQYSNLEFDEIGRASCRERV